MKILNSFLFHHCNNLIPLCMIVLLKFNLLYDFLKYMIKNTSGIILRLNASLHKGNNEAYI